MALHSAWLLRRFEITFRGGVAPNPTKFFMCLADSATLTAASPASDFYGAELPIGVNGYDRKPVVIPAGALYDNALELVIAPTVSATWTAVGSALQFKTIFLIADGAATGTAGTIVQFYQEPQTRMRLPGQPYTADLIMKEG